MVDAGTCGMRSCASGVERLRVSVCWSDGVASEVNADTFPLLTRTVYDKEIRREMVWSALTKSSDFFLYLFTPGFRTGHTRGNVTWPNADTPSRRYESLPRLRRLFWARWTRNLIEQRRDVGKIGDPDRFYSHTLEKLAVVGVRLFQG